MKHKIFALLMAGVMAFGMAGCGSKTEGDTQDNTTQEEGTTGTDSAQLEEFSIVLDWYPNAIHSFLYNAVEKGYFAEEGLDLKINFPANTNDGISMPAAGKADVGIYYLPDAILAAKKENVPIVSIGAVCQDPLNVVIAPKDSGIESAEDLKGKKIGYSGTLISELQTKTMLEKSGMSVEDCEFVDVGFELLSAMTTGQVDATTGNMVNHEVPQLEEQGLEINYFYPTDFGVPHVYEMVFLANKDDVAQNPEKYQKFLRACQKGFADMKNDPEGSLKILLDNQNEANFPLSETVEKKSMEILLPSMEKDDAPFLTQDVAVWQSNADWLYEYGALPEKADVSDLVVNLLDK